MKEDATVVFRCETAWRQVQPKFLDALKQHKVYWAYI